MRGGNDFAAGRAFSSPLMQGLQIGAEFAYLVDRPMQRVDVLLHFERKLDLLLQVRGGNRILQPGIQLYLQGGALASAFHGELDLVSAGNHQWTSRRLALIERSCNLGG